MATFTTQHEVRPVHCDDCNDKHQHFECKKSDCWFEAENLSDVSKHVVENQFAVSNNK